MSYYPVGEWGGRICPDSRMRWLKGCPDGSRSTATPASCVTSTIHAEKTGMPARNAGTILKPLVPNPHSTLFTHADWVASFSRSQHSHPPPLKVFHTPPSPPPSSSPITCTRVRTNHHHYKIMQISTTLWAIKAVIASCRSLIINIFICMLMILFFSILNQKLILWWYCSNK